MKFREKLTVGFQLAKESISVALGVERIYLLPLLSFIFTTLSFVSFMLIMHYLAGGFDFWLETLESQTLPKFVVVGFIIEGWVMQFVALFFNVALLNSIHKHLQNQPCSIKQSLFFALGKWRSILGWTLISTIFGYVINFICNFIGRESPIAKTVGQLLLGITWGLGSYFVLPLMVIKPQLSIKACLHESARLMKEKFSENISARAFLGALSTILFLAIALIFAAGASLAIFTPVNQMTLFIILGITIFTTTIIIMIYSFFTSMINAVLNISLCEYSQTGSFSPKLKQEIVFKAV